MFYCLNIHKQFDLQYISVFNISYLIVLPLSLCNQMSEMNWKKSATIAVNTLDSFSRLRIRLHDQMGTVCYSVFDCQIKNNDIQLLSIKKICKGCCLFRVCLKVIFQNYTKARRQ